MRHLLLAHKYVWGVASILCLAATFVSAQPQNAVSAQWAENTWAPAPNEEFSTKYVQVEKDKTYHSGQERCVAANNSTC